MISFKKITKTELTEIERLAREIWPVCYKEIITSAQLNYMLDKFYSQESLSKQMLDEKHVFILAIENEDNVGYLSYTTIPESNGSLHLNKIYLLPQLQGKGLGIKMLQFAENSVKELGATALELNVNKYNKALHFYNHNGYTLKEETVIDIGNGFVMDDFILIKNL